MRTPLKRDEPIVYEETAEVTPEQWAKLVEWVRNSPQLPPDDHRHDPEPFV